MARRSKLGVIVCFMNTVYLILLVLSALCFIGAAAGRVAVTRTGAGSIGGLALLPLGLFFMVLVPAIQYARVVF